jgi:hypothetical protein
VVLLMFTPPPLRSRQQEIIFLMMASMSELSAGERPIVSHVHVTQKRPLQNGLMADLERERS